MFSLAKIVLPVDFSERSLGAARYVEALAARFDSEVLILHVLPPPHYEFSALEVGGTMLNELFAARAKQVRLELDEFRTPEMARIRTRRLVLEGDPARKIVEFAHAEQAGAIVLPTHGYGPFRRFILGSVTAKVLHDADCPVWTGIHLEQAPPVDAIRFGNILCAVDLGPQSPRALRWAAALAAEYGARLTIVHAAMCGEPPLNAAAGEDWARQITERARDEIEALKRTLGVEAGVEVRTGDAPHLVCDLARRLPAELLVIGRGSAAGVFGRLRTNAYAIIRQSPCPVVSV
ncbi:MAG: universal stress protein [Acidobacteria bacterium]|nr:universal stress protein [Acidobacteriota bacterium]